MRPLCTQHPRYKGARPTKRNCPGCWRVWLATHHNMRSATTPWIIRLLYAQTETIEQLETTVRALRYRNAQHDEERYAF